MNKQLIGTAKQLRSRKRASCANSCNKRSCKIEKVLAKSLRRVFRDDSPMAAPRRVTSVLQTRLKSGRTFKKSRVKGSKLQLPKRESSHLLLFNFNPILSPQEIIIVKSFKTDDGSPSNATSSK